MEKLYTVKEVAHILGYKEQTVRNKIYNTKEIKAVKLPARGTGGGTRVKESELRRIMGELEEV